MDQLKEFEMPAANTCSDCGDPIAKGDRVYAKNFDEVRSGAGICMDCALDLLDDETDKQPWPGLPVTEPPEVEEPETVETYDPALDWAEPDPSLGVAPEDQAEPAPPEPEPAPEPAEEPAKGKGKGKQ